MTKPKLFKCTLFECAAKQHFYIFVEVAYLSSLTETEIKNIYTSI